MDQFDINKIKQTREKLETYLLSKRNDKGIWDGRLSSSALSTAVACFGLWSDNSEEHKGLVYNGLIWLQENINQDGGFGDTIKSKSNLSTTLLCWSAFSIVKDNPEFKDTIEKVENWLKQRLNSLEPKQISKAILEHYKTDRTFSVPILTMCALSGRLGEQGWKYVPQLPYQMAALPDQFFKWLNLSVVSYAIPALIAMGLVRQKKKPGKNPLMILINKIVNSKVLEVLQDKQPENGGFLEAAPLTGFVLMSLVGAGKKQNIVCKKAVKFLKNSVRKDGSWPIDTSLTTWVTTLTINSLSTDKMVAIDVNEKKQIKDWLLNQQHRKVHAFTKSKPGGWAWIDAEGGVPDGDDTSGALIALKKLAENKLNVKEASLGLNWLMDIQNRDGGFPTFCKGWGKLPFDASCPDITAHALRAFFTWKDHIDIGLTKKLKKSVQKALNYLRESQNNDGSWYPLWFGNETDTNHLNPVYGTSQVLIGLSIINYNFAGLSDMVTKGTSFLVGVQNEGGGWGGNININSSIEETTLAVRALLLNEIKEPVYKGVHWLVEELNKSKIEDIPATPIGLYFASLWYYEDMYPYVFALSALNEVLK